MRSNYTGILESLHDNRMSHEVSILESKIPPVAKRIVKIFGKTHVKETWDTEGDFDTSVPYKTKYMQLKSYRLDDDLSELEEKIKSKPTMDIERILVWIYKILKKRFHIAVSSDMRIVFESDKKARCYIELRYNKKAMEKPEAEDTEEKENDVIDTEYTEEDEIDFDNAPEEVKSKIVAEKASKYTSTDIGQIPEKIDEVVKATSTEPEPFKKQMVDVGAISRQAGVSMEVAEEASRFSGNIFDKAFSEEPSITTDLINAVKAVGGTMYGLKARLKQTTSLGRKIASDAFDPKEHFNGDLGAAAANVKDAVRYTAILPLENFVDGYYSIRSELEGMGYSEVRCKNFYKMYAEGTAQQKAVQCVYVTSTGQYFELQFHTKESQGAKEVNHPLYERYRSSESSALEKSVLDKRMRDIGTAVPDPEGVMSITSHK